MRRSKTTLPARCKSVCKQVHGACLSVCWSGSDESETTTSTSSVSCSPRWIISNETGADSGSHDTRVSKLQDCLDACVNNSRCVAVDWTNGKQCWIQEKHGAHFTKNGVTHFDIVRRCNTKSSTWHHHLFYRIFQFCYFNRHLHFIRSMHIA